MRKIKEILRLNELGLPRREIGRSLAISPNTVADVVRRAEAAGLTWPAAEEMDEAALDARLYPPPAPSVVKRPEPDPEKMHRELARKGVTLQLLWLEYKAEHPGGLGYTQFCERYRRWRKTADVRGEALRRFCRPDGAGHQSPDRGGRPGPHLRGRSRLL